MRVFRLDVRDLVHPEPLERSVEAFKRLEEGVVMHLLIHRYPIPLLQIAQNRGIVYEVCQKGEAAFHIFFTRDLSIDLSYLAKERCGV